MSTVQQELTAQRPKGCAHTHGTRHCGQVTCPNYIGRHGREAL